MGPRLQDVATTGGVWDLVVLLPKIWVVGFFFARAFLLGRLVYSYALSLAFSFCVLPPPEFCCCSRGFNARALLGRLDMRLLFCYSGPTWAPTCHHLPSPRPPASSLCDSLSLSPIPFSASVVELVVFQAG